MYGNISNSKEIYLDSYNFLPSLNQQIRNLVNLTPTKFTLSQCL